MSGLSIPWGEREHVEAAIAEHRNAGIDKPETAEQRREREAREAQQKQLQRGLSAMYHADHDTFEELVRRTIPRASHKEMVAHPHLAGMSFGELMAYRAGQHSILELIRTAAMKEAQGHG